MDNNSEPPFLEQPMTHNDDNHDIQRQQATAFAQECSKQREKKYYVTKVPLVIGDETVPPPAICQVIQSQHDECSCCVAFIKPHDKLRPVPTKPIDELSCSYDAYHPCMFSRQSMYRW